jgi:hypothetical protein
MGDDRPGFTVVDASTMPWGKDGFLGKGLSRDEGLTDPVLEQVFDVLDQVVFDDPRVRGFLTEGRRQLTTG